MTRNCWILAAAAFLCLSAACGGDGDGAAALVVDHPDALTSSGNDRLFVLELVRIDGEHALSTLELRAARLDTTGTVKLKTEVDDADDSGTASDGDRITGIEPVVDFWNPTTVGKEIEVRLEAEGSALILDSWVPKN